MQAEFKPGDDEKLSIVVGNRPARFLASDLGAQQAQAVQESVSRDRVVLDEIDLLGIRSRPNAYEPMIELMASGPSTSLR